jgi:hypothetical protein
MTLARRHHKSFEMADNWLAGLVCKNLNNACGEQQNTRCHELEPSFHNLLLCLKVIAQLRSGFSVSPWKYRLLLGGGFSHTLVQGELIHADDGNLMRLNNDLDPSLIFVAEAYLCHLLARESIALISIMREFDSE